MDRRWLRFVPVLVFVATFASFLPALGAGFVNWDDPGNFLNNPDYRGLRWAHLKWMFTTTLLGHYVPLAWLTLGLNYVLGGMDPRGYHLGNLLLHAGNATLLYLVARRLLASAFGGPAGERPSPTALALGATVAALTFGAHPLRVEGVAWVTERRGVLCGWFYLLAVLAYVRGVEGGALRGWWRAASLGAFAAALLSKGVAMTLPLTLLILDACPLRRWPRGSWVLLREKLPYLLLAAAGALVVLGAQARGVGIRGYGEYGPGARTAMVGYSLWFYPWKLVWPVGLSPLYELPARVDPLEWRFVGPLIGLLAVTVSLVLLRRRFPGGLAAWTHSAIVLAPVSGIVHAGYQLAHDRYSYLSGLGFALVAGAGVTWMMRGLGQRRVRGWVTGLAIALAGLAVLGWGAGTWRQTKIWRDSESLWRAAVDADSTCAICHNSLGVGIIEGGADPDRVREAEIHFRRAMVLRPDIPPPYYNLGFLLASQKRYAGAEALFREFIRLEPQAASGPGRLGMVYVDQGRYADAIPLLRHALRLEPDFPVVRADLRRALRSLAEERRREGRLVAAAGLFAEATDLEADNAEILRKLGQTLAMQGRAREAVAPLRRAVELDPRSVPARFWLARAYLLIGERDRADAEIAALREIDPALAGQVTTGR